MMGWNLVMRGMRRGCKVAMSDKILDQKRHAEMGVSNVHCTDFFLLTGNCFVKRVASFTLPLLSCITGVCKITR